MKPAHVRKVKNRSRSRLHLQKKKETKTSKILIKGDGLAAVAGMLKLSCKLVSIRCWRTCTCTQLLVVHSSCKN